MHKDAEHSSFHSEPHKTYRKGGSAGQGNPERRQPDTDWKIARQISGDIPDPFILRAIGILLDDLPNDTFSLSDLVNTLNLSRSQVHRKIKASTGMSTAIFIRFVRLQESRKLLATTHLNISEIAYRVGFKSPVYYSQVFKKTFGISPSYARKKCIRNRKLSPSPPTHTARD